ncbi:hypothetical protein PUN28_001891 [Cardiocondyla obscurior]|uniref:Uncharacterized protein n=1 Tax=Cardiocondyla obscurior TaxID=286306 RepID=A0AAW2GRL8_9HYME
MNYSLSIKYQRSSFANIMQCSLKNTSRTRAFLTGKERRRGKLRSPRGTRDREECRCSNIPLAGTNTAHTESRTANDDTPVPRRIFNRTRAAITGDEHARKA